MACRGSIVTFDGWRKVYADIDDDRGKKTAPKMAMSKIQLPDLKVGENVNPQKIDVDKKTTRPPPRYTEASLIKRLEKDGIPPIHLRRDYDHAFFAQICK